MRGPLSPAQLKALNEHKYSVAGQSLFEPYFQIFWTKAINYVPLWMAPNFMTILGLFFNIVSTLILVYYSPDGKQYDIPAWALIFTGVSLFLYQTLDALDGKQARRTKSSSPLGELFDHGCDSVSILFVCIGTCISSRLGDYPWLFFTEVVLSVILFYMAQWQCYVTGTLQFGKIDVTEGQSGVIASHIVTAILGIQIWDYQLIPYLNFQMKHLHAFLMISPCIWMFLRLCVTILTGGVGKNGTTVANTSVLFPIVPIFIIMGTALLIAVRSPTQIYHRYPSLFLISFGMMAAKVINKIVVAHMCKSEISMFDPIYLGALAMFFNQHFNWPMDEKILLWAVCVFSVAEALRYEIRVCRQIADFLNIYIFSLRNRPLPEVIIPKVGSSGVSSQGHSQRRSSNSRRNAGH
jgi:phosphatidylglycerophosphate synthase